MRTESWAEPNAMLQAYFISAWRNGRQGMTLHCGDLLGWGLGLVIDSKYSVVLNDTTIPDGSGENNALHVRGDSRIVSSLDEMVETTSQLRNNARVSQ